MNYSSNIHKNTDCPIGYACPHRSFYSYFMEFMQVRVPHRAARSVLDEIGKPSPGKHSFVGHPAATSSVSDTDHNAAIAFVLQ
uniref:Uncharacterized protein n=1 Tax=Burkholderia sp. B8(2020) TaxID=2713619 RepID=A0A6G6CWW0_9BURK|nr:hypothetical protein [Burkholderia sp. B8(2020)]